MVGFPLNLPDTGEDKFLEPDSDTNPMLQLIKNTCVHDYENPDTKFARFFFCTHPLLR